MLVYKNYSTFLVLGKEILLFSEDLDNTRNTIAEVDGQIHYLGNEPCNVASAIFAWQELNGRDLTSEELRQVLVDNNLLSQAI